MPGTTSTPAPLLLVDGFNVLWAGTFGFPAAIMSRDKTRELTGLFAFFALLRATIRDDLDVSPPEVLVVFDGEHGTAERVTADSDYKANREATPEAPAALGTPLPTPTSHRPGCARPRRSTTCSPLTLGGSNCCTAAPRSAAFSQRAASNSQHRRPCGRTSWAHHPARPTSPNGTPSGRRRPLSLRLGEPCTTSLMVSQPSASTHRPGQTQKTGPTSRPPSGCCPRTNVTPIRLAG